jgi:ribonucleoside-triphosphate reductase
MRELANGELQLDNGVIIPAEKRIRCEVFSRVVGYLRPVAQWNKGKKAEWADRVVFETASHVRKKEFVLEGLSHSCGMLDRTYLAGYLRGSITP